MGQLLGYGDRLGITAVTRVLTGPPATDLVLIAVGLLFLIAAVGAKSGIVANHEVTGVLKNIPEHRMTFFFRVLTFGVSAVLLFSGIWDLVHDLRR